jgi:hypothetical protein
VRLLHDLPVSEETPSRTPWWLLLLRILAAALVILGLARPVWGPGAGVGGEGPLLLVVDDGWAAAADWPARTAAATAALDRAGREGRTAALLATAPSETGEAPRVLGPMPAGDLRTRLAALRPKPWAPDHAAALEALQAWRAANPGALASLAVSDGVEHTAQGAAAGALQAALAAAGPLTLARSERPVRLLPPPVAEADRLRLRVQQVPQPAAPKPWCWPGPATAARWARAAVPLPENAASAEAVLELPVELRNQVVRLELEGAPGAGGVLLLDERFRRRPVGLLPGAEESADTPLIGDLFYLDRALAPYAEMRRGRWTAAVAPDRGAGARRPAGAGRAGAGRAHQVDRRRRHADPLRRPAPRRAAGPVAAGAAARRAATGRLAVLGAAAAPRALPRQLALRRPARAGGGDGGAAGAGRALAAPDGAELGALADGTPLVTAEARGRGRIVLFHVTATAEWSNLPLSGLFVQMLRRIVALSAGIQGAEAEASLPPVETLDGFGRLGAPPPAAAPWPARPSNRPCRRRATRRAGTARRAAAATRPAPRTAGRSTSAAPCRRPAPPRRRPPAPSCSPSAACRASATSGRGCWRRRCCCWRRTC